MEPTRQAARQLAHQGLINITQKGQVVNPDSFKGPIRLRLAPPASQHAASQSSPSNAEPQMMPKRQAASAEPAAEQSPNKAGPSSAETPTHQAVDAEAAVKQQHSNAGPSSAEPELWNRHQVARANWPPKPQQGRPEPR